MREKTKTIALTDEGVKACEKFLDIENLYAPNHVELVHHVNQALRAHKLFKKDVDYVVQDGQVVIVDEAHEMQRQSFLDLCSLLYDARQRTAAAALVLVGQPVLKKMLELDVYAPVKTRLTCLFPMPKLTIDDAVEFSAFRLKLAEAPSGLFDPDALHCLATDAKGNRRLLMNLASLCLEEAARRNDKVVTAEIVNAISLECQ